jgi:hypothetical protein
MELGPHGCVFNHKGKNQRDHFMNIEQGGSICTLHLLSLWIAECKTIFICVDPNVEGTPK